MPDYVFNNPEDEKNFDPEELAATIAIAIPDYNFTEILWTNQYNDGVVRVYISYETVDGKQYKANIYCRFNITDAGVIEDFREV